MSLSLATQRRMKKVYGGQVCFFCGRPAERLKESRFVCGKHAISRRSGKQRLPLVIPSATLHRDKERIGDD